MAAAVGGGAAAELSAGKIIPAQRRPRGASPAKASQGTSRREGESAPARRENAQRQIASRHRRTRPRKKNRWTFGACRSGQYPAARARAAGPLGTTFTCSNCLGAAASIAKI